MRTPSSSGAPLKYAKATLNERIENENLKTANKHDPQDEVPLVLTTRRGESDKKTLVFALFRR